MNSESLLQQTTVNMIRTLYSMLVLNLSLNGVSLDGLSVQQKSQIINQAKREGMENGVQDLSIYLPDSQILNLEFKRPIGGTQSDDQKLIQSKLKFLNHNYYLVRTPTQVFELIAKHTSRIFRKQEFDSLKIPNDGSVLTDKFLYFPKGTQLSEVENQLKNLYCI